VLGEYVRERAVLDLPAAVHRMTGMPASRFQLSDRGKIAAGAFADIVVFDPATIKDTATYEAPKQYPQGIAAVLVNGKIVAREGKHLGTRSGRSLRRGVA
jgi:N-acyl-D-aspartate/D-glutamate deacylase